MAGVRPIAVTAATAVQEQHRLSHAVYFEIHLHVV